MKVKITHPIAEYGLEAGKTYDIPNLIAKEIIGDDKGFENTDDVEFIPMSGASPAPVKKIRHKKGKNS